MALLARDREELDRAHQQLPERRNILTIPCDITDKKQVEEAFQQVESRFGAANLLINNAGLIMLGPMDSMTGEDYRNSLEVSFWGPFYMTQAALPMMRAQGHGPDRQYFINRRKNQRYLRP